MMPPPTEEGALVVSSIGFGVRPYDSATDAAALRAAFVELQDAERALDPHMPRGEDVADVYLERLLEQCAQMDGQIYVSVDAETGAVAGYVAVLGEMESIEPDDDPAPYAYLSDLVVLENYRGRGIASQLADAAERHARALGMSRIRLQVLARNVGARRLYERAGYEDHIVQMEKRLT
jgi:ribosomal protein S18 acetylase RimI-like enzyme